MKKVLVFGASNSQNSINKQFANYAAQQLDNTEINLLDLNDFEMPIFSVDREKSEGIPELAHQFKDHIRTADGIIISFAEHNGSYTVAYKNIFDWVSRIESSIYLDKPMLLLATSPGKRGGKGVLQTAVMYNRFKNKNTVLDFSLPSFRMNFDPVEGIKDDTLRASFEEQLVAFEKALYTEPKETTV